MTTLSDNIEILRVNLVGQKLWQDVIPVVTQFSPTTGSFHFATQKKLQIGKYANFVVVTGKVISKGSKMVI